MRPCYDRNEPQLGLRGTCSRTLSSTAEAWFACDRMEANRCRSLARQPGSEDMVMPVSRSPSRTYLNLEATKWACSVRGLPLGPKSLLRVLAGRCDEFGCCWLKQENLAAELGCSVKSVRNHVRQLEQHGLVRSIGRCRHFQRNSNVYHLFGWPACRTLPARGHPRLGPYIKEPPESLLLTSIRRQNLLAEAAKFTEHNNIPESLTTSVEEEMLEMCLEALGFSISEQERGLLTDDWPALREMVNRGYSLEAHILPVLKAKAQSRSSSGIVRSWNYFWKAVDECAAKRDNEIEKAFGAAPPRRPKHANAASIKEQEDLEQALSDLRKGWKSREKAQ